MLVCGNPCDNATAIEESDHSLDEEAVRIKKARAALFGVDSVQSIDDFEVRVAFLHWDS